MIHSEYEGLLYGLVLSGRVISLSIIRENRKTQGRPTQERVTWITQTQEHVTRRKVYRRPRKEKQDKVLVHKQEKKVSRCRHRLADVIESRDVKKEGFLLSRRRCCCRLFLVSLTCSSPTRCVSTCWYAQDKKKEQRKIESTCPCPR